MTLTEGTPRFATRIFFIALSMKKASVLYSLAIPKYRRLVSDTGFATLAFM
jgi:hypothetical protein